MILAVKHMFLGIFYNTESIPPVAMFFFAQGYVPLIVLNPRYVRFSFVVHELRKLTLESSLQINIFLSYTVERSIGSFGSLELSKAFSPFSNSMECTSYLLYRSILTYPSRSGLAL
jgi:hypothetical protein